MLPRRRFGAQWALELSTADPEAEAGSARYGARTEVTVTGRSIVVLRKRVAGTDTIGTVAELRATYRLQLTARLRLRRRPARWCRTCATSASRTSTCRPRSRRGRARRTATT